MQNSEDKQTGQFWIDDFEIDPDGLTLSGPMGEIPLEPKVMQVLVTLRSNAGDVVSRDVLMDTVWDVGYGSDESLTRAISVLRKRFGDAHGRRSVIETIPRMGYRLIGTVSKNGPVQETEATAVRDGENITPRMGKKLYGVLIGLLAVVVGVIGWQAVGSKDKVQTTATIAVPIAADDQSIAVLPFVALSTDKNNTFFGRGIAEELLNSLAQFPELKVAARTSAFSYEGQNVDVRVVGDTLGVAHVLEGSVRLSGEKLRITAQLVRTSDGFNLWSDTYHRKMTDVFEIQDEIVAELSQVLQFRLGVGAGAGRAASSKTSPQTYETYLKGLDLWWNRGSGTRGDAIAAFLSVADQDPNFADAWAAYAVSMALSPPHMSSHLTPETYPREVEAALDRALELEPENVRALAGRVAWHSNMGLDLVKGKAALDKAQALAPNDAFVQYSSAIYAHLVGDDNARNRAMQRSLEGDPLNRAKHRVDFMMQATQGEFDVNHIHVQNVQTVINTCYAAKTCSQGNINDTAVTLLDPAIQAGTTDDIAFASAMFEKAFEGRDASVKMTKDQFDCFNKVNKYFIEDEGPARLEDESCGFENDRSYGLLIVARQARLGRHELALKTLFDPITLNAGLQTTSDFWPLTDGRFEMPDNTRRHRKYHEWWARPGFPELAAARRANGKTAGLPLPISE
jgi:TolB-like protein/DNA-binding winged helix-turn-helix (wHTH) protein